MSTIVFFEKPGCQTNSRQKAVLELAGHSLEVKNLLEQPWTKEELELYMGEKPLAECFNPAAPAIKSGTLDPHGCTREEALLLMIESPLLIKRPLMNIDGHRIQGFETSILKKLLSLDPLEGAERVMNSFMMSDMSSCPHGSGISCTQPNH
ncbi:MAG: arsenate reductase family protein [Chlorobiaceae bacterium]